MTHCFASLRPGRELYPPPVPDATTGGLRAGVGEDYPNGGGNRAFLFTVDSPDGKLALFVNNSASAFDLDKDIIVDGVSYGSPLGNLAAAMKVLKELGKCVRSYAAALVAMSVGESCDAAANPLTLPERCGALNLIESGACADLPPLATLSNAGHRPFPSSWRTSRGEEPASRRSPCRRRNSSARFMRWSNAAICAPHVSAITGFPCRSAS